MFTDYKSLFKPNLIIEFGEDSPRCDSPLLMWLTFLHIFMYRAIYILIAVASAVILRAAGCGFAAAVRAATCAVSKVLPVFRAAACMQNAAQSRSSTPTSSAVLTCSCS
jgi:hypothetical protein